MPLWETLANDMHPRAIDWTILHSPEYETVTRVTTGLKSLKLFLKLSHSWFTGGGLLILLGENHNNESTNLSLLDAIGLYKLNPRLFTQSKYQVNFFRILSMFTFHHPIQTDDSKT